MVVTISLPGRGEAQARLPSGSPAALLTGSEDRPEMGPGAKAMPSRNKEWASAPDRLLEEMKHVLGAGCSPACQPVMVGVAQGSAATHGDEPGIARFDEDHGASSLSASSVCGQQALKHRLNLIETAIALAPSIA